MIEGLPVEGYAPQTQSSVEMVNVSKRAEEMVMRMLDGLSPHGMGIDPRWLAIGRTQIEQGFMAVNRAIFKPGRVKLPGDVE